MDMLFFLQETGTAPAAPAAPASSPSIITMLPMFAMMFLVMYFLIFRPQSKQRKEREAMISNLKKNDHVQTAAGIIGIIKQIKPEDPHVTLCIDERKDVCIKVSKSSIVGLEKASGAPAESEPKAETTEKKS